jgi:hypothetical protein
MLREIKAVLQAAVLAAASGSAIASCGDDDEGPAPMADAGCAAGCPAADGGCPAADGGCPAADGGCPAADAGCSG